MWIGKLCWRHVGIRLRPKSIVVMVMVTVRCDGNSGTHWKDGTIEQYECANLDF
jgi:hypothetical protein